MNRMVRASIILAVSAYWSAKATEDVACHLQVNNHVETSLAEKDDCPLPANAQWCTVSIGASHDQFQMAVYGTADIVSQSICNTGTWELSLHDIQSLGKPGRALDIGANVGFYTLVLAASGWNVTAFEPMAANTALIQASLCKNPALKPRVSLNEFGLGAKDDHCIVISGDDNLGDGVSQCGAAATQPIQAGYHKRASIDIRKLDDVLIEQHVDSIDFVKMDVEGFECQVMAGGQSLLTKYRPKLIQSEVWHTMQGCLPQDYLAGFANASYTVAKDKTCSNPDLSRPGYIENRFMCRKSSLSLLQTVQNHKPNERSIVWLQAA